MSLSRELCKDELVSIKQEGTASQISYSLRLAQVYALLDIADAIREHTATTTGKDHS